MWITNNNQFDYEDRYNGNNFRFPIGVSVEIDMESANHIFGLHSPDKTEILARNGWASSSQGLVGGLKILGNFVFSDAPITESPATSDHAEEPTPSVVASAPIPEPETVQPVIVPVNPSGSGSNLLDKLAGL